MKILASSWNTLQTDKLEKVLADDLLYESQWTFTPIYGKSNFIRYLNLKFTQIKKLKEKREMLVEAELGRFPSLNHRAGIVLRQGEKDDFIQVTVLIEVKKEKISTIEMCLVPHPSEARLTGMIPGE